jgi:hypothetical protein
MNDFIKTTALCSTCVIDKNGKRKQVYVPTQVEKNDLGVVIHTDRKCVYYEVDGVTYYLPDHPLRPDHPSNPDGKGWVYKINLEEAFRMGTPVKERVKLPKELLDRMREDVPKAFAAFGSKCIIKN